MKSEREEAIDHVVSSAKYWAGDNNTEGKWPSNLPIDESFKQAVEHVRYYHYNLTNKDVEEARRRMNE